MPLNTITWFLAGFFILLTFVSYRIEVSKKLKPLRERTKFKLTLLYILHNKLVEQLEDNYPRPLFIHGYTIQECRDKMNEIKNYLFTEKTAITIDHATKTKINKIDTYVDKVTPFYEGLEKELIKS